MDAEQATSQLSAGTTSPDSDGANGQSVNLESETACELPNNRK